MHGPDDEILYVGKAVNLYNRVHQYFQNPETKSATIQKMIGLIRRFEYIVVDSELEALILENNLIKENRPKYNTLLKDDKTYPFIKVTTNEAFPRVYMTRSFKKDGARYFGPYTSVTAVKDCIDLLHKLFKIRTCSRNLPRDAGKERPCLYCHLGQCMAPCTGKITTAEYQVNFLKALDFLNGKYGPVKTYLAEKMNECAASMAFEDAAGYRDLLQAVDELKDRQKVTSTSDVNDRDIIGIARSQHDAVAQVFFMRGGVLIGRENFHIDCAPEIDDSELVSSFVNRFYTGTPYIPREIWLQSEIKDCGLIEKWLMTTSGHKCRIIVPKNGEKKKMVRMAIDNASIVLKQDSERLKREELLTITANTALKDLLALPILHRIESYDISNTNGFEPVGSMVVFQDGKPLKSNYRKFRIRNVSGPNDVACMTEMLERRFQHDDRESSNFGRYPDLILMDGGKQQVSACEEVVHSKGLFIPVAGMVKDDHHRSRGLIYRGAEIEIDPHSEAFKLLTRIQDETHRFAIEFHKSLRSKKQVHSILDDIPGIGPKRRLNLLRAFPSLEKIQTASMEQLKQISGMDSKSAAEVFSFFHKEDLN